MNDKLKLGSEEIDIFEFIEILFKRKYIILFFFAASILFGVIYSYFFMHEEPNKYSIHMVLKTDAGDNVMVMSNLHSDVQNWFQSGTYKGILKEESKSSNIPDIIPKSRGSYLLELRIIHPDLVEGKRILKRAREIMINSESCKKSVNKAIEQVNSMTKLVDNDLNLLSNELVATEEKVNYFKAEKKKTLNKIAMLKNSPKEWGALRKGNNDTQDRNDRINESLIPTKNEMTWLFSELERQVAILEYSSQLTNKFLGQVKREITIKQIETDKLKRNINALKNVFEMDGPLYDSVVPAIITPKYKPIGIAGVFGGFLGVIIGFLLEIKNRRRNGV